MGFVGRGHAPLWPSDRLGSLALAAALGAALAAGTAYILHRRVLETAAAEERRKATEKEQRGKEKLNKRRASFQELSRPASVAGGHGSSRLAQHPLENGHTGSPALHYRAAGPDQLSASLRRGPSAPGALSDVSPRKGASFLEAAAAAGGGDDDDEEEDDAGGNEEDSDDEEGGPAAAAAANAAEEVAERRLSMSGMARENGDAKGGGRQELEPVGGTGGSHHGNSHHGKEEASSMTRSRSVPGEIHSLHAPDPIAADILRKEPEQETFVRLKISPVESNGHSHAAPSAEEEEVCILMQECLELRSKYVFRLANPPWHHEPTAPGTPRKNENPFKFDPQPASEHTFAMVDGVVRVYAGKDSTEELYPVASATKFFTDLHRVLKITSTGSVRTLTYHRLRLLEQKFNLHLMLNADREFLAQKSAPHRDFYNVRKVDTHVHHSACMNQKHLLRFIKSKLRREADEVVIFRDGKYLTLKEVFESLDLTGYDLNVDLLDVHADKNTFHRFDKFNLKYNPCGQSRLREIFIKQDNLIQGRFLAELTKEVFSDLAVSKYQMAEYRVSVYGRKKSEWNQLASWVVNNDLYSENVVWLIQLPRLYHVYREMGIVDSFQNILDNVFEPLFEVTVDPASHPHLHSFLKHVVGFDMVDDESKPERRPTKHMPTPVKWNNPFNPAYAYWAYYVYANLYTLNKLRESKGLSTIKFRPHAGEAGDVDHLAATFLLAHNIAHGNNLRKAPGLQYLYYLAQIGLAMSPLSNNSLFLDYHRNPFPMFFSRGLNVSLSTDDPLQIHLTKEPLVEEYSIAAQVWKLSACDLCEIARNSVYQSGFSHETKAHWVGQNYYKKGPDGNDIHKTNVPHMRVEFRHEVWLEELSYIYFGSYDCPQEIES